MEIDKEPLSPRNLELGENRVITLGDREVEVNSITVCKGDTGKLEEMRINFGDNVMELCFWIQYDGVLYMGSGRTHYPKNREDCALDLIKILSTLKNKEEAYKILEEFMINR